MIPRQLALFWVEAFAWAINTALDALTPDPLTGPMSVADDEPTPHGDKARETVMALRDMRAVLDAVETVEEFLYVCGEDV